MVMEELGDEEGGEEEATLSLRLARIIAHLRHRNHSIHDSDFFPSQLRLLPNSRFLNRSCFLKAEDGSADDHFTFVMATENPATFKMLEPHKPPPNKKPRKDRIRGKSLDREIWKDFPEDLFEAVIARLPVTAFFRFRSVCLKWNSLLDSESFSKQCLQIPKPDPWFYTITHESVTAGAVYDPAARKWHRPATPSPPTDLILMPAASSGGLVCFHDLALVNFYVSNPLTPAFKELPSRSVKAWSRIAVGMTRTGNEYKIVSLGCNGEYVIYDSALDSWTQPENTPPAVKLPLCLNYQSQTVSVNGVLYFMRSEPEGVVSYDTETRKWTQYVIPSPTHLTDRALAEVEGRVVLVGLLSKNAATCVCVWELQRMTLLWKEVDRMPNVWCLEYYGKHVRMTCLGNTGLLMLSLRSRRMNRLVTYDAKTREWLKVPGWRKRQSVVCGTAFHPCLTATP